MKQLSAVDLEKIDSVQRSAPDRTVCVLLWILRYVRMEIPMETVMSGEVS